MELYQPANTRSNISPFSFHELTLVEEKLYHLLRQADGLTQEACLKLLQSGGKRLRPLLVIQSGMCFSPLNLAMIDAAVASELIHTASLVHDDIIDQADLRRGVSTTNSDLGNYAAVLTGDYIFAQAFSLLASHNLLKPMEYMCQAIQAMCSGEINQAGEKFDPQLSLSQYFKRMEQKTSALLTASCKAGASCAGASDTQLMIFDQFGTQIGYAFQIIDDLKDYVGIRSKIGKPVNKDLTQGHITLPLILCLQDSSSNQWVKDIILRQQIDDEELFKIQTFLEENSYIEQSIKIAQDCINNAKNSLNPLPVSNSKTFLINLAEDLMRQIPMELAQ